MGPKTFRIAEIAIRVRDLAIMTAFYRDMLGFEINHQTDDAVFLAVGPTGGALDNADHPQLLALFNRTKDLDHARSTFDHIAFEIDPGDYQVEYERFNALGMIISERNWPESLPWRGQSFFFRDPENNVVEIIAALPTAP